MFCIKWQREPGREQRPAGSMDGPGEAMGRSQSANLPWWLFLPTPMPPWRRWGVGSFRAWDGLGRSSERGIWGVGKSGEVLS